MDRRIDYHNSLFINRVSFPISESCTLAFTPNIYCVSVINFNGRFDFFGHILDRRNFLVVSLTEPILSKEEYLLFQSMLAHADEYKPQDYPLAFAMRENEKSATNEAYSRHKRWKHGSTTDFDVIEFKENAPYNMPQFRSILRGERSFQENIDGLRILKELESVRHTVRIDSLVDAYYKLLGK